MRIKSEVTDLSLAKGPGITHGSSSNPGDLGEDIKNVTAGEINSMGGIAPATNCN